MTTDNLLAEIRRFLFCFGVLASSFELSAATLTGKVIKVADGDTITILVGTERHRIRLQGIDAPSVSNRLERLQGALCRPW